MEPKKGIDVSEHQGLIDWDKVKADGIQFAMIRCGYGSDLQKQDDKQFERNVQECERVNIPWGAYLYSYALNQEEAISEANHVIRLLENRLPSYPIALDMEDADQYKAKKGMPDNQQLVAICQTFLSKVKQAGFEVMLYANKDWLTSKLSDKGLEPYHKWLAQWNNKPTYQKQYSIWQFSSTGRVRGIKGNVDLNWAYVDFGNTTSQSPTVYNVTKPTAGFMTAFDAKHNINRVSTVRTGTYYVYNVSQKMVNVTKVEGLPGSWINPLNA
ncbi:glycoside hydrolase family 25 protein [Aquibacillus salsiterrae]|uniref:Glycoside hydrolase family 25 protein n=1 Tax=Aquibacillus salsiterrae TaxID=2950439 RepID=A0A9X3WEV3_9BACI|nr:glycoside hydrolase family 25 protein [Aquibacillus salsiterrae]MDC3417408.1 glycoside hydrolase family 25 protein [Aquibacillus salsiterrae]